MSVLAEQDSRAKYGAGRAARLTEAEEQAVVLQARQIRAQVLDRMVRGAIGGLLRESGLAALGDALLRAHRRRRTAAELSRLDDALLRDIGLQRGDIPFIAEQVAVPEGPARSVRPSWLVRWRQARLRRGIRHQLEALPDWALEDIGIPRHRIGAVATRMAAQQAKEKDAAAPDIAVTEPASVARDRSPVHDLVHHLEVAVRPLRQWQISRVAANQMARLNRDTLRDLGYVKGDIDWVPEIMAQRRLKRPANQDGSRVGAA